MIILSFNSDKKYLNIKSGHVLTMLHSTYETELPKLINGIDANQMFKRLYNAPAHKGLFVTGSIEVARRFGSGRVILEMELPAKDLFGTDFAGKVGTKKEDDAFRDLYPNSFRPSLTESLLREGEAQALFIGRVKPSQIKRVMYKGKWYTRDNFLKLGVVIEGKPLKDLEVDVTEDMSIDQFFSTINKSRSGQPYTLEKLEKGMVNMAKKGEDALRKSLRSFKFLTPDVINGLVPKIMEKYGQ